MIYFLNLCNCGCGTIIYGNKLYVHNHHQRGKPKCIPEEVRQKISKTLMGNIPWNKGKCGCVSEEGKNNISNANKGCIPWNKGKKLPQYSGENACNWIDGRSFLPYCNKFNQLLKEEIRERDNRVCQNCEKSEIENKQKLSIHHIHYDKENCNPDLIALCNRCNLIANGNRNYWEEFFMNNLNRRNLLNWKIGVK